MELLLQKWESLNDDKNEQMRRACCKTSDDSSYLEKINNENSL